MYCRVLPVAAFVGISLAAAATVADRTDQPSSPDQTDRRDERTASANATLHLGNGGFIAGVLEGSDDPNVLQWRSPAFAQPFAFPLSAVTAAHYSVPQKPPQPQGEYCFELAGDDIVFGNLLGLTDDVLEIDAAQLGRVHLRREHVRRFYRWSGADLIYLGPNGLTGWKDSSATPQWRDEGGRPLTDQPAASLFGEFALPAKAVIEFELSWKGQPDFVLALGVNDPLAAVERAFRIEAWDGEIVAVGESERDADVASLQPAGSEGGRVALQAYLDQEEQRLLIFSRAGERLAGLRVNAKKPQVHGGLRLTNKKGAVRLERLRINRWNGVAPREAEADKSRLHRTDGSIVYGRIAAFDPQSKQFTLRDGETEAIVAADATADIYLSPSPDMTEPSPDAPADPPADPPSDAPTAPAAETAPRNLRVAYQDGSQFSGQLTGIDETHISLICPGVKEPLRLPIAELRSLIVLSRGETPAASPDSPSSTEGRPGRLELEGARLSGRLVNGDNEPEQSCLVWHPDLASNSAALFHRVAGRIVYRDPPPPQPAQAARPAMGAAQVQVRAGGIGQIVTKITAGKAPAQPPATVRRALHLRTGDTVPYEVAAIDEEGVTFKSPISEATFVPHERIKALELAAYSRGLDKAKRERLLTLPRLLRDSPPTHLICSKNGDILRARLLGMDDKQLKVEVRLETRVIPRDRVAHIIWLHADELSGETVAPAAEISSTETRVQILQSDGNRLTFRAEKVDGKVLSGTSDLLGACRADLTEIDQLLFGAHIEEAAARLAYHRWKLQHAKEPAFVLAADGSASAARPTGTESPLVGQPAPGFELDLLDGNKFRLADHKGKVVVLDFWATWCGPCLQTMPLVDGVVGEFDGEVMLVAVNMEEQPPQIRSMFERHKLKMPVALDRDGVVAIKYTVTALPQTVVIDREGKVARLFVGGGPKLVDPLREALRELSLDE